MSMLDVAKYLNYSRSIDHSTVRDRIFNLSMVNSGRLFSCLHGDRSHWSFGREQEHREKAPVVEKGV